MLGDSFEVGNFPKSFQYIGTNDLPSSGIIADDSGYEVV